MWRRIASIRLPAWMILLIVALFVPIGIYIRTSADIPAQMMTQVAQPIMAIMSAGLAFFSARHLRDKIKNRQEKIIIIVSILAIWFVVYFLSGLALTYVYNSMAQSFQAVFVNLLTYGIMGVCLEYARHKTLLLAGRKNYYWFGLIVTIIFALPYMNFAGLVTAETAEDIVKIVFVDMLPGLTASALLTYLALTSGFGAMLAYRVGLILIMILPPILPKYDWYLIGVTSIIVALVIYLAIDRTIQGRVPKKRHLAHRMQASSNVVFLLSIVALVLFMTGFFAYKPIAIMSNSMKPIFSRGSMVIVDRSVKQIDINIGDIIQYESQGKMVTHRVIDIEQGDGDRVFITQGDNSPSQDPPIESERVVGVVRAFIPFVGYPTVWLRELTK